MERRHSDFVRAMVAKIMSVDKLNKRGVESFASRYEIHDQNLVKELTELAIVKVGRYIANHSQYDQKTRFKKIVELYENQVNLSHRTSQSILLQQYSTPAPIGYLAGIFCELDKLHIKGGFAFEPSAGNGLLTIAGEPGKIYVNEIDPVRRENLKTQGFANVWDRDATEPFIDVANTFVAVVTNPPFGSLDKPIQFGNTSIKTLDQVMALRALDTMEPAGKAAIIIGGHTNWDEKGRVQAGKNRIFINHLYHHFNVADIINIDGKKLYSRQGTSFNVRLILIDGKKAKPEGFSPLKSSRDIVVSTFDELYNRVVSNMKKDKDVELLELEAEALALELELIEGLGAPYYPSSQATFVLNTVVPDSMDYEIHSALERVRRQIGGSLDDYVLKKLNYSSKQALFKAFSAEQIDALALAIYNIEEKEQGMIIGDQTGIGKGRVAAGMIRYGVTQGNQPIFLTEKANLFSDIYRDLEAIGSADLSPFIVNARESKTDVKDENGKVVYQAPPKTEQSKVFADKKIPKQYNFILATYSQFNSPQTKPEKPSFLLAVAKDNIMLMDESHNASGSSNTGEFLQSVLSRTKGVVFLSATFAKRPDNMPVYAMKTAMSEANMTKDDLVTAITRGGVALQEVLSSQLVQEGQMIRRERSFEGIEVNYITLDQKEQEHKAIADNITAVLRNIISFQRDFVDAEVEELDKIAASEGKEVELRQGTNEAGVTNSPYFSKVFNVINQMLFAIKAEEVAYRAIERLREGKKPVIAFASTMGSFIEQMENENGLPVGNGDVISADFSEVLKRGLDGVMRYTEITPEGEREDKKFNIAEFSPEAQANYFDIYNHIKKITTGITISPIDVIVQILEKAGYRVAEVTGRKYEVQLNRKTGMGMVKTRQKINTNDAFREFNNNEVDVLLINQSGSTGASAHAIVTPSVPKHEVKQRVMIVLQPELDINTEVQKRGRINRTGQILKPIYDYVNSAIPAEKRLTMMLQKKLKSLDANTSSNQKQSDAILSVEDFLNKYGDKVVAEYLMENPDINEILNDPLKMAASDSDNVMVDDAAHKVSGRVAVLSTEMQENFYREISDRYRDFVEYMKQTGEYDLEVEAMDLQAEVVSSSVVKLGKGGNSAFGDSSILNEVTANVLRKPFSVNELSNLLLDSLEGEEPIEQRDRIMQEYKDFSFNALEQEKEKIRHKYERLIQKVDKVENPEKVDDLIWAMEESFIKAERTFDNRQMYLSGLFKYFHVGKGVNFPEGNYESGQILTKAVFLGFGIDKKKKNPYAPSAIKCRFALASPNKYLAIPASYSKELQAIKGASYGMPSYESNVVENWSDLTTKNTRTRTTRYIVTGNILQAFSSFAGKLVSYTTMAGTTEKGILMPDYWEPKENASVIVPIARAKKIIAALPIGQSISTSEEFGIIRQGYGFKLIVPASRQKGGKFYLDQDILKIVQGGNFNKVSTQMVASLDEGNIGYLIDILQDNHSQSVELTKEQFALVSKDIPPPKKIEKIDLPERTTRNDDPARLDENDDTLELLELEALALALELELLTI